MQYLSLLATQVRTEMAKVVIGQQQVVDQLLLVLLCGGHAVIEGVPGLAKTLAVKSLARICALGFSRVQCTADLMPADVTGTNVFNLSNSTFNLHKGPIFTDLLLVDEINRTSPRTQAALLEAMEERQVTIDGTRYPLSENFTVLATQNPIEFEGTYPLPEAQLDRFLLKIRVKYPSAEEETKILTQYEKGFGPRRFEEIALQPLDPALLPAARQEILNVRVEPALQTYVVCADSPNPRLAGGLPGRQPARGGGALFCGARHRRDGRARLSFAGRREGRRTASAAPPDFAETRGGPGGTYNGSSAHPGDCGR